MKGVLLEMEDVRRLLRQRGLNDRGVLSAAMTGQLKADADAQRHMGRKVLWFTRDEVDRWLDTLEQPEGE